MGRSNNAAITAAPAAIAAAAARIQTVYDTLSSSMNVRGEKGKQCSSSRRRSLIKTIIIIAHGFGEYIFEH
jgi:hypothetical protein